MKQSLQTLIYSFVRQCSTLFQTQPKPSLISLGVELFTLCTDFGSEDLFGFALSEVQTLMNQSDEAFRLAIQVISALA